jgi:O-glycosyl hydrolase
MNKRTWMTETSGYVDIWEQSVDAPGAFGLAQDIHSGLYYGNISAWVWWQGSQLDGIGEYNLMNGTTVGKKYYVSKHFYRYIRPGAVRIKATSGDEDHVFITAYKNDTKGTVTLVVINANEKAKSIYLEGNDLPSSFVMYRTTKDNDNCTEVGMIEPGAANAFTIPAKSIITLQAGGNEL